MEQEGGEGEVQEGGEARVQEGLQEGLADVGKTSWGDSGGIRSVF